MKKIIYILISSLFLTGCDLDKLPLDSISPQAYFNTENELRLYTNSFYDLTLPKGDSIYGEAVDNIIKTDLTNEMRGSRVVPTTGGYWLWYPLRNINFYLENSVKCEDEAARARYDAVAKFFRVFFYFDKVKRFGDVPWYTEVIGENDEELLSRPRSSRTVIIENLLEDINYAIEYLPTDRKVNEVSRWTALALKARMCLFEGTFRKYHTEFNLSGWEELLDEAANAAYELITQSGYTLYSTGNPETDYLNLFASNDAIPDEIILARSFSDEYQVYNNLNYYTMTASYGRPGLEKRLVNSYLMRDGSRFTDQPGYETMFFTEEVKNRDPRLSQTVRTPGYTRIGGSETLVQEFGSTVTGYQLIKFVSSEKYDTYEKSLNDMPIFRFAEALLNYAEAKAERGSLTQADLDLSVNLIRDRVGMPHINMAQANANPDPYLQKQYPNASNTNHGIILELRRERRIELVMENFRWDDMMRWKEGATFTGQFKGMYFPGIGTYDLDGDGTIDICVYKGTKPDLEGKIEFLQLDSDISLEFGESGCIVVNPHIQKTWDENKDYLWPVPIQERILNPNLTQNPGWNDGLSY